MSTLSLDNQAGDPPERRNNAVRLAVLESNFDNHTRNCEALQGTINSRLGRIEKGIIGTVATLMVGGATVIGILLKILLHLG